MLGQQGKLYMYFTVLILLVIIAGIVQPFSAIETGVYGWNEAKYSLHKEIKSKADDYEENPEDAYIDSVWKKTPGRNGRAVDIAASYQKMKKHGSFQEDLLVFKETAPKVTLADLPPSPVYRGHPDKSMVALMINVSWGEEHIPSILETLKESKVKATFFIEGKWASKHKSLVEMIDEENHLIGNHAYNHPDMDALSDAENKKQISETNDILEAITGKRPQYFAPPSGSFNDSVVRLADDMDMETMLWTVDTIDWQHPSVSVMLNRVNGKIHPGATVLMHPTDSVREGLGEMIRSLEDDGYETGTVESLLDEKR